MSDVLDPQVRERDPKTGIDETKRQKMANGLSAALADSYILLLNTQGVHWNVEGPLFYGVHKLTEEQYEALQGAVDEIAERIRQLGFPAPATYKEYEDLALIRNWKADGSVEDMVTQLAKDNADIADRLRKVAVTADELEDIVTSDLLGDRSAEHEEAAWMLRSITAK